MSSFIKSPVISFSVYDVKTAKGKPIKVKGRDFYSITYRKKGEVKINVAGKTIISTAGCITVTPKRTDYTTEIINDTHMIAIHFDCIGSNSFDKPFVYKSSSGNIQKLFDDILEKYSPEDINNYECYSIFYKLLSEVEKHFLIRQNIGIHPSVIQAKAQIELYFRDRNFNIDSLVSSLPISASYLRREFKKTYSVSPIEYLKYIRLQNAISLLSADYYSVEDLALKCGYSSTSYFIQSFKKATGFSPTEYKKAILHTTHSFKK